MRIIRYMTYTYRYIHLIHTSMHMYVGACMGVCVYITCIYWIRKGPRRREISSKGKTFIDLMRSLSFCLSHSIYLSLSRTHTLPLSMSFRFSTHSLSLSFSLHARVPECLAFSYTHWRSFCYYPFHSPSNYAPTVHKPSLHAEPHCTTIYIYVYTPSFSAAGSSTALASFHFQD